MRSFQRSVQCIIDERNEPIPARRKGLQVTSPTDSARQQRYAAFQNFLNSATERFNGLCNRDDSASHLRDIYSLCITPGGRAGGKNSRQLEVFFGARPYDQHEFFDSSMRPTVVAADRKLTQ